MDVRSAIAETDAVLEGEFFFALKKQGNVSCKYINVDPIFTDPELVAYLGDKLIEQLLDTPVEAFVAPATGGIPLIYAAANAFVFNTITAWADKQKDGTFAFERMNFARVLKDKHVVVLEDIVSSGGSARAVADLVRQAGGKVVAGSIIWNRGNVTPESAGVPMLYSLIEEEIQTWGAGDHPMWGKWPLVEDIGHPEYFPNYPGPRIKVLD